MTEGGEGRGAGGRGLKEGSEGVFGVALRETRELEVILWWPPRVGVTPARIPRS